MWEKTVTAESNILAFSIENQEAVGGLYPGDAGDDDADDGSDLPPGDAD